ncbi:MAG: hypothetical protein H6739_29850 [Alphaproteobacteria bacterium]|nr:hypothetical protein [Alphaproteobacteria bacterium]
MNPQLPALPGKGIPVVPGDYDHLRTVVEVNYPVRAARVFLNRHLSNRVTVHLVEAQRGERVGHVRAVQVNPAAGGEPAIIRGVRTLPDGSRASHFVPDDLVTVRAELATVDGRPPGGLDPRDTIVLHIPVRGYLRFLPGAYQGAVPTEQRTIVKADEASTRRWGVRDEVSTAEVRGVNTDATRRFLFIYQHMMTSIVDRIEQISSLTDPLTADPKFLPWIASWVTFTLDESLPLHQQRELVRRAIRLYRTRGTKEGVEEIIRVLTAAPVKVSPREKPQPFALGAATLAGGRTPAERYVRSEGRANYLYKTEREPINFFALVLEPRYRFEKRFSERAPAVLRRLTQIVTAEKPAHITFTIRFEGD